MADDTVMVCNHAHLCDPKVGDVLCSCFNTHIPTHVYNKNRDLIPCYSPMLCEAIKNDQYVNVRCVPWDEYEHKEELKCRALKLSKKMSIE